MIFVLTLYRIVANHKSISFFKQLQSEFENSLQHFLRDNTEVNERKIDSEQV
jgi:hypothetical protein